MAKRQHALLGELLDHAAGIEAGGQHVAQITKADQRRQHPGRGGAAEHVAEEDAGDDDVGADELVPRHRGKVGHVDQQVEHGDGAESQRRGDRQRPLGILELGQDVVDRGRAAVGVAQPQEDRRVPVQVARAGAGEQVLEVARVRALSLPGQSCEAGTNDDREQRELEERQSLDGPKTPFRSQAM